MRAHRVGSLFAKIRNKPLQKMVTMKRFFRLESMKRHILFALALLATSTACPNTLNWTNTLGGDWFVAQNWSPNIVPGAGDTANISQPGTYSVTIVTGAVSVITLNLGGQSGTQTLIQGSPSAGNALSMASGIVSNNGLLVVTNGGITGSLTIQAGAQLQLGGDSGLFLYNLNLTNLGTVTWSGGNLEVGGSSPDTTVISNGGLWQITSDYSISSGGGPTSIWINFGTVRKSAGSGISTIAGIKLLNQPGGIVDAQSGTLRFSGVNSVFGGTMNAVTPAHINLNGTWTDAGGSATGTGKVQFDGGTFNFINDAIPGLVLVGGDVYIAGNSFQQGGAITNLTIDGAALRGTNIIGRGTLRFNTGAMTEVLTVEPGGQLVLATANGKLMYGLVITNLGTVTWNEGTLGFGGSSGESTFVLNGGVWQMASDDAISWGGGSKPTWVNTGMLVKSGTTGISTINGLNFLNQDGGVVEADSGTIQLPIGTTNAAGTLRLNGGKIEAASGTLEVTGGMIDGNGSLGAIDLAGGTLSPGLSNAGSLGFASGINLGNGAVLSIDGSGLVPGSQYDQLSVSGAGAISNCTLQVTALPSVSDGTTFTIIANHGGAPISGTFNGLPENALLNVGSQLFRVHYAGGSGNDVTLVRSSASGLQLTASTWASGGLNLAGMGSPSVIYTIQASTNFLQWTDIGSATSDVSGAFKFSDTNAALYECRFYRATK